MEIIISRFFFFLIFAFVKVKSQEDISQTLNSIYSQMSQLPIGSTVYFLRNIKCVNYDITSSICLVNDGLYKVSDNEHYKLLIKISEYSESFYYELNLYNESNINYKHCIITHFVNENQLIFKYYFINNEIDTISNTDFSYYNESLNPINKGINCHTQDMEYNFSCFYINKEKNIIQMDINPIYETNQTFNYFKTLNVGKKYIINANTLIMSFLFKNKFKYFSCNNYQANFGFHIYFNDGPSTNFNNYQDIFFKCKDGIKMVLFGVFDESCNNCQNYKELFNLDSLQLSIIYHKNNQNPMYLMNRILIAEGIDNPPPKFSLTNFQSCSNLFCMERENILLFKPIKAIIKFKFDDNQKIPFTTIQTIHHINDIPTQGQIIEIPSTDKITNEKNDKTELFITKTIPINPQLYHNNTEVKEKIKKLIISKPNVKKEEILEDIEEMVKDTVVGETYEYQSEDFSILIYPTNSDLLTNKTHIDFVECEYILKSHYNLSNESIITFFQMEISNKNERSLINQVEYQVYDESKNNPLDLSLCNNSNIKIFYGIKNDSNLDLSIINSFKDSGVNVFNISDEFFNDICFPYTEGGNDLMLEDRIKYIYQNFTLCEEGCTYEEIDISNMLISCKCNIKENMTTIITEIQEEAAEQITSLNFEIVKCYNLVFSFNGKMKNIGFWILSVLFLVYIISLIIYCCNGIKPVKNYIINQMVKFGYINEGLNTKIKINKTTKKNLFTKNKKTIKNSPPIKKIKNKNKNKNKTSFSFNSLRKKII